MIKHLVSTIIVGLLVWQFWPTSRDTNNGVYPNKPIQLVVPYLAGGGTDTFARIIQKSLVQRDTLGVPVVIMNQDGGSATIGSRYVKNSDPDGYRLLCHHEGIMATKLAEVVPYGPEAFTPIAQTGSIVLLMVVRADSEFESLNDLLAAAQKNPNEIRVGANQGSPAYFICKQLLAEYPGADFNFISASGSKRVSYLLGDKLEAGIFSLAEYKSFRQSEDAPKSNNIRAIANFSKQRHAAIPNVATSLEQDFKTHAENAYYVWAPKNTPDDVVTTLANAFKSTLEDPNVVADLENLSLDPTFRSGDELAEHLAGRVAAFEKLAVKADAELPNFAAWTIGIVMALFGLVLFQGFRQNEEANDDPMFASAADSKFNQVGVISLAILIAYVIALQFEIPFVFATPVAIFLIGATIAKWNNQKLFALAQMALLVSLSIQLIFTKIFTVALP
jgi:tripartite-type tricarboxylate transporter receptor subunit TctC